MARDARRYNLLAADGWTVLRFAWEDVMLDRDYLHSVLVADARLVAGHAQRDRCRCEVA